MTARTLYDKLWDSHVAHQERDGTALLYIDRHLVHEVTSPQAYEGLKLAGRKPWRVDSIVATADHNTPTRNWDKGLAGIADPVSRLQVETLDAEHQGIRRQGLFSVPRPAAGHRARDRAGAGRDAARHDAGLRRFAYQHARRARLSRLRHRHERGRARARDAVHGDEEDEEHEGRGGRQARRAASRPRTSSSRSSARSAPPAAPATRSSSPATRSARSRWKGRMTLCNMSIEAGARAGMVAVDEKTIEYVKGRPLAPKGAMWDTGRRLLAHARRATPGAKFDKVVTLDAAAIQPQVTWGTNPQMVTTIGRQGARSRAGKGPGAARVDASVRSSTWISSPIRRSPRSGPTRCSSAPAPIRASRTCARRRRWSRASASHPASSSRSSCPGPGRVKQQAEQEGLDKIFTAAGFEWRQPGCSMCLGMNDDQLSPGERCASTSNRNFEGRQGPRRQDASGEPGDGCGRGDRGAFRGCPHVQV